MKRIFIIFCFFFLTHTFSQSRSNLSLNSNSPEINITNWIYNTPKNKELKNKVIILEFWATWCGPCIKAIPHLNEVQKRFETNEDVIFLSISDEKENIIKKKLEKIKFDSVVVSDTTKQTNELFGVNFIPLTIIIDKQNIIKWIGGPLDLSYELINEVLENKPISKKYVSNIDFFSIKDNNQVYLNIDYKTFSKLIKNNDIDYYFSLKESSELRNTSLKIGDNIFSYSAISLKKLLSQLYDINYNSLIIPKDLASKKYSITYKNNNLKKSNQKLLKEVLQQLELKKENYKKKRTAYSFKLTDKDKLTPTTALPSEFSSFSVSENILITKKQTINNLFKIIELKTSHTFNHKDSFGKKYYDFKIDLTSIETIKKCLKEYGFINSQKETYIEVTEIKHSNQ